MVFHAERCAGASPFQQQNYSTYQETGGRIHDGGYTNFSSTTPYSQVSACSSGNSQHHQSGWSTGGGHHANGASHYHGNSHSHGHNGYGNSPNGVNYGYQETSWTMKNLDD